MFGGELAALAVGDEPALGDAQKCIVGFVILPPGEERLVGGDERNAARVGKLDQRRLGHPFGRHTVTLQFDVEAVAEQPLQMFAARYQKRALSGPNRRVERPIGAAAERNQPVGLAGEPVKFEVRPFGRFGVEIGARAEPHQAAIAILPCRKQHDPRPALTHCGRALVVVAEIDAERAADDRLDARTRHLLGEFERTEHIVGVGERERRLPVLLG